MFLGSIATSMPSPVDLGHFTEIKAALLSLNMGVSASDLSADSIVNLKGAKEVP